jgi:uncharacterized protein with PIN domain
VRLLVDECLSRSIVEVLRARGHDVRFIRDDAKGETDVGVLAIAVAEDRILITEDRDFGLLTIRNGESSRGVIVVAASSFGWSSHRLAAHVSDKIDEFGETCVGSLTTIEPGRVRQRKLER